MMSPIGNLTAIGLSSKGHCPISTSQSPLLCIRQNKLHTACKKRVSHFHANFCIVSLQNKIEYYNSTIPLITVNTVIHMTSYKTHVIRPYIYFKITEILLIRCK